VATIASGSSSDRTLVGSDGTTAGTATATMCPQRVLTLFLCPDLDGVFTVEERIVRVQMPPDELPKVRAAVAAWFAVEN
jgi:hypothetical protein